MQKIIRSLFVVAALASVSQAAQPWASGGTAGIGATSIFEIGLSTPALTPLLISAGPGGLGSASISSSTAGGNCVFFDSATTSGITSPNQDGTNVAPRIANIWFTTANTNPALPYPSSTPFRNGLVVICSILSRVTVIGFRN